jgi:Leucine-rich repeat (LRR) protein
MFLKWYSFLCMMCALTTAQGCESRLNLADNPHWSERLEEWVTHGQAHSLRKLRLSYNEIGSSFPRITRFQSLYWLDLSHNNLDERSASCVLVNGGLEQLRVLNLSYNKLGAIPFAQGLYKIKVLNLAHNLISHFHDSWEGFETLRVLNLSHNDLGPKPTPVVMPFLKRLHTLKLAGNNLRTIPQGVSDLISLHTLSLCQNNIGSADDLGRLTNLKALCLSYNEHLYTYAFLESMTQLEVLKLRRCGSVRVFLGPSLKHLDLSCRKLWSIPASLTSLTRLEVLNLQENELTHLPDLSPLVNLRGLYLDHNQLTEVPKGVKSLPNMTLFTINHNPLKIIPVMFPNWKTGLRHLGLSLPKSFKNARPGALNHWMEFENLQFLDLSHSAFADLPEVIYALPALKRLDLSYMELEQVPEHIGRVTKLETLDLSHNQLVGLPQSIGQLKNLKVLFAEHNSFIDFPKILCSLLGIEYINLDENHISHLPPDLAHLTGLESLELGHNEIRTVSQSIVPLWLSLGHVSFFGNPLEEIPLACLAGMGNKWKGDNPFTSTPFEAFFRVSNCIPTKDRQPWRDMSLIHALLKSHIAQPIFEELEEELPPVMVSRSDLDIVREMLFSGRSIHVNLSGPALDVFLQNLFGGGRRVPVADAPVAPEVGWNPPAPVAPVAAAPWAYDAPVAAAPWAYDAPVAANAPAPWAYDDAPVAPAPAPWPDAPVAAADAAPAAEPVAANAPVAAADAAPATWWAEPAPVPVAENGEPLDYCSLSDSQVTLMGPASWLAEPVVIDPFCNHSDSDSE